MKNLQIILAIILYCGSLSAHTDESKCCFSSSYSDLSQEHVIFELDDDTFADNTVSGIVVVNFYASWSGPCSRFNSIYQMVANQFLNSIVFAKVDVDQAPETTLNLKIYTIPTVVIFVNGEEVSRLVGFAKPRDISAFILNAVE